MTTATMTATAPDLAGYWRTELASLRELRAGAPSVTYRDWQPDEVAVAPPAARQSVRPLRRPGRVPAERHRARLRVGDAVDQARRTRRDRHRRRQGGRRARPRARMLPRAAAAGVAALRPGRLSHRPRGRHRGARRHRALDARDRAEPGLALFQSFLHWAEDTGRLYEDEHFDISVPELAEQTGCEVALADGCRIFLPKAEHYAGSDAELDDFNAELRSRPVSAGGPRYAAFPEMNFTADDIDVLHAMEEAASVEERMHFGFLHYYLLDAGPARVG